MKKKVFTGYCYPVKQRIEFDAGKLVGDVLNRFSNGLYLSPTLDMKGGWVEGKSPKRFIGKIGFFIHTSEEFVDEHLGIPKTFEEMMIDLAKEYMDPMQPKSKERRKALSMIADKIIEAAERVRRAR